MPIKIKCGIYALQQYLYVCVFVCVVQKKTKMLGCWNTWMLDTHTCNKQKWQNPFTADTNVSSLSVLSMQVPTLAIADWLSSVSILVVVTMSMHWVGAATFGRGTRTICGRRVSKWRRSWWLSGQSSSFSTVCLRGQSIYGKSLTFSCVAVYSQPSTGKMTSDLTHFNF